MRRDGKGYLRESAKREREVNLFQSTKVKLQIRTTLIGKFSFQLFEKWTGSTKTIPPKNKNLK